MFKIKIDIDRHGPRPMPNNCKNFNPPNFSLPTTFKQLLAFLIKVMHTKRPQSQNWSLNIPLKITFRFIILISNVLRRWSASILRSRWRKYSKHFQFPHNLIKTFTGGGGQCFTFFEITFAILHLFSNEDCERNSFQFFQTV